MAARSLLKSPSQSPMPDRWTKGRGVALSGARRPGAEPVVATIDHVYAVPLASPVNLADYLPASVSVCPPGLAVTL